MKKIFFHIYLRNIFCGGTCVAGYRRFVAYVYEYLKEKKGNNCGFIKVEVREQRCTLEVHLQCPGIPAQSECRIY